jgi:hypothetical protein
MTFTQQRQALLKQSSSAAVARLGRSLPPQLLAGAAAINAPGNLTGAPVGGSSPGSRTSFNSSGKGGGAFRSINESFKVDSVNGTLSLSLPIHVSSTRQNFQPSLAVNYDSGSGNGPFGFGWSLSVPSVSRQTSKQIPTYDDDKDVFISGAQELVPVVDNIKADAKPAYSEKVHQGFMVRYYRPRVETSRVRVERWTNLENPADVHWRTITSENVTHVFGETSSSRISDSTGYRTRIFCWLVNRSYDAAGNAIEYLYKAEDSVGVAEDVNVQPWEKNRSSSIRNRQKYLKRICYGNRKPCRDMSS